jgi:outer membrane protein OmpA-like peptidoglycan-associated protein
VGEILIDNLKTKTMRILITGSLVFLLWVCIASWLYVCKIKPSCEKPAETAIAADTAAIEPSPPPVVEIPKPETLILYFDYNNAEVKTSVQNDQQTLLFQDWLGKHPETILYVTGHADNNGPDAYNKSLGMKRALNTKKYLEGKGLSPEKIKTDSKGETEPVSDNATDQGRAKNRRAEITLK